MVLTTTTEQLISQKDALTIIDEAIANSEAEGVSINLSSSEAILSRFSENQITQNIHKNKFTLSVTSYFGSQSASASTSELDSDSIKAALRRSEELAQFAPEDPEWVELLPKQVS